MQIGGSITRHFKPPPLLPLPTAVSSTGLAVRIATHVPSWHIPSYCRCWSSDNRHRTWTWTLNASKPKFSPKNFRSRRNSSYDDQYDDDAKSNKNRRRWWSDYSSPPPTEEQVAGPGILEEFVDSIWFLKVLQSYGWMSPLFVVSLLAATGPKAVLITLALPLGQSLLTFAISKLWGWTQGSNSNTKPRAKAKRKRKTQSNNGGEEQEYQVNTRERKIYQSWVAGSDNIPVTKSTAAIFGGWDELVAQKELKTRSESEADQTMGGTMDSSSGKQQLNRRNKGRNLPLLLRLLVAVFPFLGSWTSLL